MPFGRPISASLRNGERKPKTHKKVTPFRVPEGPGSRKEGGSGNHVPGRTPGSSILGVGLKAHGPPSYIYIYIYIERERDGWTDSKIDM